MRVLTTAALVMLVACSPEDPTPAPVERPGASSPSAAANADPQEGGGVFVVTQGEQELYRESFERSANQVTSTIQTPASGDRIEQIARIGEQGVVDEVIVTVRDASGVETQRWKIAVEGKTATVEGRAGEGTEQTAQIEVPENTIPLPVGESVVMAEQILRQGLGAGGSPVSVILIGEGKPEVDSLTVTPSAEGARIEGDDSLLEIRTDAEGRIISAVDPQQNLTIRREARGGA